MKKQGEMFALALDSAPLAPRLADLCEQALIRADSDLSPHTMRCYAQTLQAFFRWCETYGEPIAFPVPPLLAVTWCQWQANHGYARETIRLRMRALSSMDERSRGMNAPAAPTLTESVLIRRWWRSYARDNPQVGKGQAPYVSREQLAKLVSHMYGTRTTPSRIAHRARNRAIIVLGYTGAFRRGELSYVRYSDLELTDRGLRVHWRRSKSDMEGDGETRLLMPQAEALLCPVDAWKEWRDYSASAPRTDNAPPHTPESFAFCGLRGPQLNGKRMTEQLLYQLIVKLGADAGVPITPHSLRASFATHAREKHDEASVAYAGRWKSRTSMGRYVRRSNEHKNNATSGLSTEGKD